MMLRVALFLSLVLLASCASVQVTPAKVAYSTFAACDVATTVVVLNQGGQEMNPLLSWGGSPTGIAVVSVALKLTVGWLLERIDKTWVWWAGAATQAVPCAYNATQLR